jgi:hypothetical protein
VFNLRSLSKNTISNFSWNNNFACLNVFSINKSTGETQKWGEYKLIVNQNGWQSEDGVKFKISGNIQSQTLNLLHTSDSNGGKPVQTQLNLVNCDQGN